MELRLVCSRRAMPKASRPHFVFYRSTMIPLAVLVIGKGPWFAAGLGLMNLLSGVGHS